MSRTWISVFSLAAILLAAPSFGGTPPRDRPSEGSLKVGDLAPDFELKPLDGKATVKLSSFRDRKPVALVFGSYT
jgi:hypothetical protein